jgi:segregation and condensation protein B
MDEPDELQMTAVASESEETESSSADGERSSEDAERSDDPSGDATSAEHEGESRAGESLSDDELLQAVTVLVFASAEPISEKRIASLLEGAPISRVRTALDALSERLRSSELPLELVSIAGGFQILTAQRMSEIVQRLFKERRAERVSPAALETLAVIAYRQPVTKAEIEAIRGVQVAPILRTLIDRGLVRVVGRADVPGHPLQYGTTREFLDKFGLGSIDDLPRDSELAKP